jgi:tRNA(adenine34) deaminase
VEVWSEVDPAWRRAFELAWEAYGAGTIPVGAVVTDADGSVLAEGRNRVFERSAPAGQISGSLVAHAELNALAELGIERRYFDCTLRTTLEPCPLCIGAAWVSTIGRASFAARDVIAGAANLIERHLEADRARNFPLAVDGPLDGALAVFAELLPVAFFLERGREHHANAAYRARRPQLVALAEAFRLRERADEPLDDVVRQLADEFQAA